MSSDVTGHVPQAAVDSDHSRHDQLLVARLAAGDASEEEQPAAQALVDGCSDCAALAADLRLLSSALASLPQPARQRDFRLTQEQADRLRGGLLQRLTARAGRPGGDRCAAARRRGHDARYHARRARLCPGSVRTRCGQCACSRSGSHRQRAGPGPCGVAGSGERGGPDAHNGAPAKCVGCGVAAGRRHGFGKVSA